MIFSSRIAGSERYCVDLANRQAALGHEVHVAGMRASPLEGALAPTVSYHGFRSRIFRGMLLRRLVTALAPHICHGHLSAACKALSGTSDHHQKIATLHVGYKPHQHGRLDGVICVNRAQSTRLEGFRGLTRTIPNWMPQVPAETAQRGIREELGLGADVFLVGAVGRLHKSKGMDVLISAFRTSAPARAALVILGDGPQRAELERLRAGDARIHLPGYRPGVYDCLRDLDLFVSPSREESFGLAILEAMSTGVPIVATAAEGPGEFLLDQPVELVPPGSIAALASALAEAGENFRKGRLSRIAYDLGPFNPSDRISSITDFYWQVIEARQWSQAKQSRRVAIAT